MTADRSIRTILRFARSAGGSNQKIGKEGTRSYALIAEDVAKREVKVRADARETENEGGTREREGRRKGNTTRGNGNAR